MEIGEILESIASWSLFTINKHAIANVWASCLEIGRKKYTFTNCVVPENIHTPSPPHGGSWNFLGVGGSKRDKFPKGRGVHKEFLFPEGLKCDRINTYVFFPIDSGNQKKRKVLSVEIDVGFLVIYFLLLFRRQTTHTALRHTSKYHVFDFASNKMADKKNIVLSPLTLAILSKHIANVRIAERSSNMTKMTIWCTFCIFSLNATGAFSDSIIRAVIWYEIINIAFTHVSYLCEVQLPANFKASITTCRLSQSFFMIRIVTSLEMLAKSIRCDLSWCIIFCNRERWLETARISFGCLGTGLNLKSMFYTWNVWQVKKILRSEIYYH